MNQTGLDPVLSDAIARYDASRAAARLVLADLSDLEVHQRPSEAGWSVAHCIQHLVTAGTAMSAKLAEAVDGAQRDGRDPRGAFHGGWFDRLFVRVTGPPSASGKLSARVQAPTPFVPPAEHVARAGDAILADYLALQDRLTQTARRAAEVDLGVRVASVASDWIRVRLGSWFSAIAGHQERHLLQARRTRAAIGR